MSVSARPTDEAGDVETTRDEALTTSARLAETQDFSHAPPVAPTAETMPYSAGDVIANKYRLTKILGEGGMGAVWLARNLALEIDVAIKLIRHEYANAEGAMRLLQEARAAARIGHPCIVRVFDFGTTERADPFIVMEVLQGESLAQTIERKGKLSAVSAVRTLLPVAGALAAAHGKGIVHRDLKPDNIRLVTDDRGAVVPKVVDFGIAKLHHDDLPRETTQAGVILGSPHYMSPEQACGRDDVDLRTDVWAFSVMLYEVITGVRPFEGTNYNALISSILVFDPLPWMERDVHEPELWEIIKKGLAKEREDRWASMQQYGEALATWAAQRDVETDAAGNSLRAHWLASAMHRPLSEFPSSNAELLDVGRPRMVSEREISVPRLPSMPEIVLTNPQGGSGPGSLVMSSPSPPSSLPATTHSEPPTPRRSPVMWIGPMALAAGVMLTAAIYIVRRDDATRATANQTTTERAPMQPVVPSDKLETAPRNAAEVVTTAPAKPLPIPNATTSAREPSGIDVQTTSRPSVSATGPKPPGKTPPTKPPLLPEGPGF